MRFLTALGASLCLLMAAGAGATTHAQQQLCGPEGDQYVCGQIIVALNPDVQAIIEDVVARHGHDPATAILEEITDGTYLIAVPEGEEEMWVASYGADPDIQYAELNRVAETQVPDTAAAGATGTLAIGGLVLLLAGLVIGLPVVRHARAGARVR